MTSPAKITCDNCGRRLRSANAICKCQSETSMHAIRAQHSPSHKADTKQGMLSAAILFVPAIILLASVFNAVYSGGSPDSGLLEALGFIAGFIFVVLSIISIFSRGIFLLIVFALGIVLIAFVLWVLSLF